MSSSTHNKGIARFVTGAKHIGMGIVVDARHVMTCCHVVNQALDRKEYDARKPTKDDKLSIQFPYANNASGQGIVDKWGLEQGGRHDIAIVELDSEAPSAAGVAIFSENEVYSELFTCNGFNDQGIERPVEGRLGRVLHNGDLPLCGNDGAVPRIEGGYSGGAVWSPTPNACVGMVTTKDRQQDLNSLSYAIPTRTLKAFFPSLQIHATSPSRPLRWPERSHQFIDREEQLSELRLAIEAARNQPLVVIWCGDEYAGHEHLSSRIERDNPLKAPKLELIFRRCMLSSDDLCQEDRSTSRLWQAVEQLVGGAESVRESDRDQWRRHVVEMIRSRQEFANQLLFYHVDVDYNGTRAEAGLQTVAKWSNGFDGLAANRRMVVSIAVRVSTSSIFSWLLKRLRIDPVDKVVNRIKKRFGGQSNIRVLPKLRPVTLPDLIRWRDQLQQTTGVLPMETLYEFRLRKLFKRESESMDHVVEELIKLIDNRG